MKTGRDALSIAQVNYAFDTGLADPDEPLDRYFTLTGWSEALAAAGAANVAVVQRFHRSARIARNGIDHIFSDASALGLARTVAAQFVGVDCCGSHLSPRSIDRPGRRELDSSPGTYCRRRRHMMKVNPKIGAALALLAGVAFLISYTGIGAQAQTAPRYKFDPDWPKPLPNKWKMGGVTGLAVDKDDNVWVLNRPNDLTDIELEAELTPPVADCCVRPPSMIHIDKNGTVIGSFDAPQGHGMDVDSKGFVYIGQDTVRKYDPKTGKVVAEVPRTPEREGGGGGAGRGGAARVPGRGGAGPVAGFLTPPGGRGQPNPDAAAQAAARTAFRAKYPPTTPMIVGGLEEIRIDEAANEMYVADSYLGGRVMVFDMNTFAFKRGWGAYGHMLSEITTNDADRAYTPGGQMPKEFRGHLTLNFSNDGLVYAADRNANRIHVTTKDGKFLKEFIVAPMTGVGGATGGVAFSPDKQQKYLFISDLTNNKIWYLNREDGKVVGQMGSMGENGGQWFGLHMIAVDSKGSIYTGEVFAGERVQRFVPAESPRGKLLEQLSRLQ